MYIDYAKRKRLNYDYIIALGFEWMIVRYFFLSEVQNSSFGDTQRREMRYDVVRIARFDLRNVSESPTDYVMD